MDTWLAMGRAQAAIAAGSKHRVFDWDKAARLIRERQPKTAGAGLGLDWEWTGGTIYQDGEPMMDPGTYLASIWATPELDLDGEIIDCYVEQDGTGWNSSTVWPDSALAILRGA